MEAVKEREITAKKRSAGRPKKVIKRDRILMVRLTLNELMIFRVRAREAGISISEWLRQAAREGKVTPRLSPQEMQWFRDLSGIANNLNQLTRLAHTKGLISFSSDIRNIAEQTSLIMEKLIKK